MDYTSAQGYVLDKSGRRQFANRDLANNVRGTDGDAVDMNGLVNSLMYVITGLANLAGVTGDDTVLGQAISNLITTAVSSEAAARTNGDAAGKSYTDAQIAQEAFQRSFEDNWLQNYIGTQISQEATARANQDTWLQNWVPTAFLSLGGGYLKGDITTNSHISVNVNGVAWGGNQGSSNNPVGAGADGWYADGRSIYHFSSGSIPMYIGTGSDRAIISLCNAGGSQIGSIARSGSSVTFNGTSDYRLKTAIAPLSSIEALDRIATLRPVSYSWKDAPDTPRTHGFIAHELAEVAPHAVAGKKDAVDKAGSPQYQLVDLTKLIPDLVAANQALMKQIDTLETRLSTLEKKHV